MLLTISRLCPLSGARVRLRISSSSLMPAQNVNRIGSGTRFCIGSAGMKLHSVIDASASSGSSGIHTGGLDISALR